MNKKQLGRIELEEVFNKFKDVPHVNQVKLGGFLHSFKSTLDNPKNKNTLSLLEVYSSNKIGFEKKPYVSKIGCVGLNDNAEKAKAVFEEANDDDFLVVNGLFQNYANKVKAQTFTNEKLEVLSKYLKVHPEDNIILEILKAFNIVTNKDDLFIRKFVQEFKTTSSNIRIQNIEKRNDLKEELKDRICGINECIFQGLVYMSPDYRETRDTKTPSLHLKLLVNRNEEEELPYIYRSKENRDIVDVITYGEQCKELFVKIEQGHPLRVKGSLESGKYKEYYKLPLNIKETLAKILETSPNAEIINSVLSIIKPAEAISQRHTLSLLATDFDLDFYNK